MKILSFNEMLQLAKDFYSSIDIKIPKEYESIAVQSLTMPEYAKEYNDKNKQNTINDHRALATVGDAICGSYVMLKEYKSNITSEELSNKKSIVKNENLNNIGKDLLQNKLFAANNDLTEKNIKSYATAFEAVIGFIGILDKNKVNSILDKYIKYF